MTYPNNYNGALDHARPEGDRPQKNSDSKRIMMNGRCCLHYPRQSMTIGRATSIPVVGPPSFPADRRSIGWFPLLPTATGSAPSLPPATTHTGPAPVLPTTVGVEVILPRSTVTGPVVSTLHNLLHLCDLKNA
mmetsp:Transcript_40606/g.79428  ORF Transcript_40606/g.79428 Transcript_40606/m.79428 type:complete len:133 (+) Transcript_40606:108-506(+)